MLNVTMSISTRIVNVRVAVLILVASILGAFVVQQSVSATNVNNDFINFITRENERPASNAQAAGLAEQITSKGYFEVCYDSASYASRAVNGKDGGGSFMSLSEWMNDGTGSLDADWRNKSKALIGLLVGEVGGGMRLEYRASDNTEGWCSYIIRMASQVNIPITAEVVVIDNEAETKTLTVSAISENCSAEFNTASQNIISTGANIQAFIYGLSTSDYNNIVKKHAPAIVGQGAGSSACTNLTTDLKTQIDAEVAEYCAANATEPKCEAVLAGTTDVGVSSSCVVEGVGWIICPIMNFMAGIVDAAYSFVDMLLQVQPLLTTGDSEGVGVYNAWTVMRNISNLAFVIVFLIIIFSQLTGMGVSNYGVKKMLPRLIIGAILVNVSFWICAIAVDISNIVGASMIGIFEAIGNAVPDKPNINAADNGEGWAGFVGAVLAGTAAVGVAYYLLLSALIPALLAALVAIITVFLVLTLRQALIILLIVIAPLAFVAYLLPNTEDWFTKWRKLLMTLLLMYPIIAGIFGASALASLIVMNSSDNTIIQIMGACIAILPLALTPLVMKTAGGVLNRFAGIVNNADRGPIDRLKKVGQKYHEGRVNMRNAQALKGKNQFGRGNFVRWRARRGAVAAGRQSEANRANTEYVAKQIQENSGFKNAVAGGGLRAKTRASEEDLLRAEASAISARVKLEADEVNAASAVIKEANLGLEQMQRLAKGLDTSYTGADGKQKVLKNSLNSTLQTAAIQQQFKSGDIGLIDDIVASSGSYSVKQRQAIAEGVQSLSGKVKYYGGATSALIASGDIKTTEDLDKQVQLSMEQGKFSVQDLAMQDKDAIERYARVAAQEGVDSSRLVSVAQQLQYNTEIYPTVEGRKRDRIEAIVQGVAFSPGIRGPEQALVPPAPPAPPTAEE